MSAMDSTTEHISTSPEEDLRAALQEEPGLRKLLPIVTGEVLDRGADEDDGDVSLRCLLDTVLTDPEMSAAYRTRVPADIRNMLGEYVESKMTRRSLPDTSRLGDEVPPSTFMKTLGEFFWINKSPFEEVLEADGKPMVYVPDASFKNWGNTVTNSPSDTFVARTKAGLCNLVKWAGRNGKKVRVAGYRHTWSDFFSADNEVLVMLLPLLDLTSLPAPVVQPTPKSDLQDIEFPSVITDANAPHTICRIGAGCTNDLFRRYCLKNRLWCLPFNVIMIEITFGGSNAPICHGAGLSSKTLSDLVVEFEYVDSLGRLQTISDPEELRAASGCFGLLGICTSVTLRLDRMGLAAMNPEKADLFLAIPPPRGYKLPPGMFRCKHSEAELEKARLKFAETCEGNYYVEWFWFPYRKDIWINCWDKKEVSNVDDLKPYPSPLMANIQWAENALVQLLFEFRLANILSAKLQAKFLGRTAMASMPHRPKPKEPLRTLVSEALHFRRGIQNMRVLDSEWEIPIPEAARSPGKRDYELIMRAWWDGLTAFYKADQAGSVPMRLALEMRLTGDSDVLLAPQRGNKLGTISIEVLTTQNTPTKEWGKFMQAVADAWTQYKDKDGNLLNARPHWAKQWQHLTVRGKPIIKYLREDAYKSEIPEFRQILETICRRQGTDTASMRERFGNPLLEELFFL